MPCHRKRHPGRRQTVRSLGSETAARVRLWQGSPGRGCMKSCMRRVHQSPSESARSPSTRCSRWPATAPAFGSPTRHAPPSSRRVQWSTSSRPRPHRPTGSPPASVRWRPGTSPPRCGPSCRGRWSARTPPAPGPAVEREVVRGLMLLRLSTLATGRTGVRPELAELMAAVLNAGITPVVHEYGSLGCSGDLAPLSHCALALMGEGEVHDADGVLMPAAQALEAAGLAPIELVAKEGLALINGTDGMLGMLVMALTDLGVLMRTADVAAAMSVEGQLGTDRVFAPELQAIRPHPGQAAVGGQPHRDPEGLRRGRLPPRPGLQPRPGRLLAALLAPGARRRARHPRPLRHGRRPRAGQRGRQPRGAWRTGSSPTATSTGRRSPTCSTSRRSWLPTSRRSASGVPTGSWTATAATACRRSSPTTPGWTAGT